MYIVHKNVYTRLFSLFYLQKERGSNVTTLTKLKCAAGGMNSVLFSALKLTNVEVALAPVNILDAPIHCV